MAKLISVGCPKVIESETLGKGSFSITFTQKAIFNLSKKIEDKDVYIIESSKEKKPMNSIHTNEYYEIEKIIEDGKLFTLMVPDKEN